MIELVLSLIPIAIAAALQPPQVIALVILLLTRRGIVNALAFIAGMTAFRLLLGGAFWLLISPVEETIEGAGGEFDLFVGSVLVVLAFLMLAHALRRGLSAEGEDRAAASWMEKLEAVSPPSAALLGVAFLALDPKDWIIDLSAVNLIADADLSGASSIVAYLAYIVMAQSLLWIPLILMLVVPSRARHGLVALNTWMKRHERSIEIIVALVFGVLFLYLGLEQLGLLGKT
jgi:threonine/homoserine/homoserine lactone efflux protein